MSSLRREWGARPTAVGSLSTSYPVSQAWRVALGGLPRVHGSQVPGLMSQRERLPREGLMGTAFQVEGNSMYQAPKVEISSVDTRTGKVVGEFPGGPVVRTWHFHC